MPNQSSTSYDHRQLDAVLQEIVDDYTAGRIELPELRQRIDQAMREATAPARAARRAAIECTDPRD